jgi:hypothetical protein
MASIANFRTKIEVCGYGSKRSIHWAAREVAIDYFAFKKNPLESGFWRGFAAARGGIEAVRAAASKTQQTLSDSG